jgi:FkbH-like protein
MEAVMADDRYIRLYGKLEDKYGDNGVITVVLGRKEGTVLHIELWLMSCRVLKRDMELAMLDSLVEQAKKQGIRTLKGYYFKTPKNNMVREFYGTLGFTKISEQENGDSEWELEINNYENKNKVIKVVTSNEQN